MPNTCYVQYGLLKQNFIMKITERKTKIWHGTYRGVAFEINNFKTPPNQFDDYEKDNWTYYLILHLSRIPKENKPESFWLKAKPDEKGRVYYPYHKNHIITNIDFAGGCSWYSKEAGWVLTKLPCQMFNRITKLKI